MASFQNGYQFTIEDNVLKGKVVSYHDDCTNLGESTLRRFEADPDFVGQIDAVTGEEYTYEKMRERSVRCALWMRSQGLRPRDVILIWSNDQMDFTMPCFAALYLGVIFCPCDGALVAGDFLHRMNVMKPKMVFVREGSVGAVVEAAEKTKLDLQIIVFGRVPGFLEFDSIIAEPGIDEVKKFSCTPIESSDEIAVIFFSSGTTGLPKGVSISHRASTMLLRQAARGFGLAGNVCFIITAVDWITIMDSMFTTQLSKTARIVLPPFEEHSICTLIEKYKASWVYSYPSYLIRLKNFHALDRYDLSSLTKVLYSGSKLPIAIYEGFKELVPNIEIITCYGMSETCGVISIQSKRSHLGSCGEIMENAQLKVIDPDTGRTLGVNQPGELLLKFTCMMSCYYNDPQATAEAIDKDGWIHSGDFGYYDEGGEVFLIDRLKDIVRLVDVDVSPFEIENVILYHPGVKEVAVVGQRQPHGDDLLIAFVVRAEDSADTTKWVTETEIVNLVATELPDNKHLRAGVRFVDNLPKTRTNKIQRLVLRDLARAMVTI